MKTLNIKYYSSDNIDYCLQLKAPIEVIRTIKHYFPTSLSFNYIVSHQLDVTKNPYIVDDFFSKNLSNSIRVKYKDDIFFKGGNIDEFSYRYKENSKNFFFEFHSQNKIRAIITCEKHSIEVVRLLRTLLRDIYEASQFVCFHAGAFKLKGLNSSFMVVGDSGTGKSSTVWEAVKHGAGYISNDRVLVGCNMKGIHACTYATAMRLGYGLVNHNIEYLKSLNLQRHQLIINQDKSSNADKFSSLGKEWGDKNKLELTPFELCNIHSAEYHYNASVDGLIVTNMNDSSYPTVLKKVSWYEVEDIILKNIYLDDPDYTNSYIPESHVHKLEINNLNFDVHDFKLRINTNIWILEGGINELSNKIKEFINSY
ncbi:hypothetical protein [Photorhabdus laumondii]